MGTRTGRSVIASPHGHLVLVVIVSVNVVYAQNCGCASGLCCSKWGYCETTSGYCGDGCQSGPCTSSGGGSPSTGGGNVGTIISQSFFDGLAGRSCCSKYGYCGTTSDYCGDGCQSGSCTSSGGGSPSTRDGNVGTIISQSFFDGLADGADSCEGKGFYTYDAFIAAAHAYSGFGTTGSSDDQKRELAAFFDNVMHETGELCYINEIISSSNYCHSSSTWPCASGKSYHGRGPIQLRWNYNYGPAGQDIGFDGVNNPEKVGQDATISFKTAVWFWMKNNNCHSAITYGQGFGGTIKAINGVECDGGNSEPVNSRELLPGIL